MTRFNKLKERIERDKTPKDITYEEIKKYLKHYGYELERINGSHHMFVGEDGDLIILPIHSNRIKYVYVKKIIDKCGKE